VPKAAKNSAQAMEQIARMIYDASSAHQDLQPYLNGVMTAFGVPPLGTDDVAKADSRYKQGLPLIFLPQLAQMADEFNDGDLYTLDSFIAAANARGARQRGTDQPLTREYLSLKFANYSGKAQYEARQALPAFVLALSRERAQRLPSPTADPLWGDGLLDPLQTTLLIYSISYAGAKPVPHAAFETDRPNRTAGFLRLSPLRSPTEAQSLADNPIVGWVTDQLTGEVTGEIQEQIGIPLDQQDAAQVTLCASLILYGHRTEVKTAPEKIYHEDGSHPAETRVNVTVRFQDDYYSKTKPIDRWLIETLGNCDLPVQGLARGAKLDWSVSDGLRKHGNYDITQSQTDKNGTAWATWRTVPETTPESLRSFYTQREAVGSAIVRVSGLVDGWDPLEKIVNLLRDTGAVGQSRLTVIYYEIPGYRVDQIIADGRGHLTGTVCALDKPFSLTIEGRNAAGGYYLGDFAFAPANASGGSWIHKAKTTCIDWLGCGTVDANGTYETRAGRDGRIIVTMHDTTQRPSIGGESGEVAMPGWEFELVPDRQVCLKSMTESAPTANAFRTLPPLVTQDVVPTNDMQTREVSGPMDNQVRPRSPI
jgi:hypothetical protein